MKARTKKLGLFIAIVMIAGLAAATSATAQTGRRASNIKSNGNFDFDSGKVTIYSSDLIYLADEIDLLEDTYKTGVAEALDQIGTYFKSDGTSTHNRNESTVAPSEATSLPFGAIREGIINSQSIPTERTYTGTLPGQATQTSGNISAAQADHLSLGTAAWVDGDLIIGTGADNNTFYTQGSQDGYNKGYEQGNQDGYNKGYAQGDQDGYNKGYAQGNKDGHDSGYNQGVNDGMAASKIHMVQITDGDIKSLLPDVYQSLSVDNFFVKLESVSGSAESDGQGQKSTYYGVDCKISYDAATGRLTVDGDFSGSNVMEDGRHSASYTGYSIRDYEYGGSGASGSVRGGLNVNFSLWCVY